MTAPRTLRFGFVPLIDCAIPVVAQEKGFAARHGLTLDLEREASWAAIRDKLSYGLLDAAHLLAGIPLAAGLGIGGVPEPLIAPMALGLGGNGIVVSTALHARMLAADPAAMAGPRSHSARALRTVIAADRAAGRPPLSFATVFPVSSHNYELRYWLAAAGIDPDRDLNLSVIAPPRMVESLRAGWIDGYCVGEPWAVRAVETGAGVIVATKGDIWPNAPEKVLGLRATWATAEPETVQALLRALIEAAQWADAADNRAELAALLAQEHYLGTSEALLRASLEGRPVLRPGAAAESLPDRHVFFRWQATFPWRSQALWLLSQMRRWGQCPPGADLEAVAEAVYRPDLYRTAAQSLDLPVPGTDRRVEGRHPTPHAEGALELGPDCFLDGRVFDPADLSGYLAETGAAIDRPAAHVP